MVEQHLNSTRGTREEDTMNDKFDAALVDLGFSTFGVDDTFEFALQRDDGSTILVSLYRDQNEGKLRMSAYTSKDVPFSISREFFTHFAQATMEPFRGGTGIGMPEGSNRLCAYFSLPVNDYLKGNSVIVLESLIEQVEKWDDLLPHAAG